MKILHISYTYGFRYTGGAAIAAARLHNYLLDEGVESYFLCVVKKEDGRNVIECPPAGSWTRSVHQFLAKAERNVWRFVPGYRTKIDINCVPLGLGKIVREIKPDLIQVHKIGSDMLPFEELLDLDVPVVYTLHDFWLVNGFDPYPYSDRRFVEGFTRQNSSLLERWLWRRKVSVAQKMRGAFIAPSAWAAKMGEASIAAKGKKVYVVPYFIGPDFRFMPEKRLPHPKFRILFGCNCGMHNEFKGFDDLVAAIRLLPENIQADTELHVFGDDAEDFRIGKTAVKVRGIIEGAQKLVDMYHEGDVFAMPSKTETQGMVKIEAMLCGLPVLAFNRTACPESIDHQVTGWVAKDGDLSGYSQGLAYYYGQWKDGLLDAHRKSISTTTFARYSNAAVMARVKDAYAKILGGER